MNRLTLFFILFLIFWSGWYAWKSHVSEKTVSELSPYKDLYQVEIQQSQKLKDDVEFWKARAIVAESTLDRMDGIPKDLKEIKRNLKKLAAVKDTIR